MVVMTIGFEAIGTVHETVLSQRLRATGKSYHQVDLADVILQPGGYTPPGESAKEIVVTLCNEVWSRAADRKQSLCSVATHSW